MVFIKTLVYEWTQQGERNYGIHIEPLIVQLLGDSNAKTKHFKISWRIL